MRHLLITTALALPIPLWAQDVALVLGQERYEQLDRVRGADDVLTADARLEALGFEVFGRANGRVDVVREMATTFQAQAADADRLVVALSGHFVNDGTRSWLLTAEAGEPDLFTVDQAALSLDSVLQILATRQGKAVLLLGQADIDDLDLAGSRLSSGVAPFSIPQGVTVIRTSPSVAATTLSGVLTNPEAVIGQRIAANAALEVTGFLPRDWVLMPGEVLLDEPIEPTDPSEDELTAEAALWDDATAADTVDAYRAYLARFPQGRFIEDAETQIEAILAEPNRTARLVEERLGLTRDARREVQSNLTLLSYNTLGVDGIFGSGSRGAITNWQQSNGFPQTSYLTLDQINLLDAQAARRQAEIDAEAARALAAVEQRDRTYWAETGGQGDEPGYKAYLERYPEGLFATIAAARLNEIEDRRRTQAETADRAAWSIAQSEDSVAAYEDYLAAYPDGVFTPQAAERLEALTVPQIDDAQIERARAEEAALRLSGVRAQLLELRLRDLGQDPGRLDGVIDNATRRAISDYQNEQGLTPTGYVDQATAVGLMTGSIEIRIPGR